MAVWPAQAVRGSTMYQWDPWDPGDAWVKLINTQRWKSVFAEDPCPLLLLGQGRYPACYLLIGSGSVYLCGIFMGGLG